MDGGGEASGSGCSLVPHFLDGLFGQHGRCVLKTQGVMMSHILVTLLPTNQIVAFIPLVQVRR